MHKLELCYLTILVLNVCAMASEIQRNSGRRPLKKLQIAPTSANKNARHIPNTQQALRSVTDNEESVPPNNWSRTKRFVEQFHNWLFSKNPHTTPPGTNPEPGATNRPPVEPHGSSRKNVNSYKDPNRTHKLMNPDRRASSESATNTDVTTLRITTLRSEVDDSGADAHQTASRHDLHARVIDSERMETEDSRSQNRPPWLDKPPDDGRSEDRDEGRTTSSPTQPESVTAYAEDTRHQSGSDVTQSYTHSPHVTSQPSGTGRSELEDQNQVEHNASTSSVDDDDAEMPLWTTTSSPSLSSTSTSPAAAVTVRSRDRRRRIRYRHKHCDKLPCENLRGHRQRGGHRNESESSISQNREDSHVSVESNEQNRARPKSNNTDSLKDREANRFQTYNKSDEGKGEDTLATDENSENGDNSERDCPTCGRNGLPEEEIKAMRINMFTELLAQKLRIEPQDLSAENSKGNASAKMIMPKLPPSVWEQTMKDNSKEDDKDDFYARDQEVIIEGDDMGTDCFSLHATGCYRFNFDGRVQAEITDAQLWLYKMRDRNDLSGQTFIVYQLQRSKSGELRRVNLVVREETFTKDGWVSLNVTRSVIRWLQKRRDHVLVALRCKTCATRSHKALYGTKNDYKPLLIIKYDTDSLAMRGKRDEEECDPRVECCKRNLEINFRDIGLPSILQPSVISVGYCFGFCGSITQYSFNHTALIQRLRWGGRYVNDPRMRAQLEPCCVPLVLKDSFIFTNENGMFTRKILPRVIVQRCGCL